MNELNLKCSAIIFGRGFWWCNINCFSSPKDFSPGFDGAVNPLNNLYTVIPHELNSIALLCNSSKILFASKKKCVPVMFQCVHIPSPRSLTYYCYSLSPFVMFKSGINNKKRIFQTSSLRSDCPLSNLLEKVYCYIYWSLFNCSYIVHST